MSQLQKKIQTYLKEINRLLPAKPKEKNVFLAKFKEQIDEYLDINPDADYEELIGYFGEPNVVVQSYIEAWGLEIKAVEATRKLTKKGVLCICIVIAIICCILLASVFASALSNEFGFLVRTHA